ncbi:MAG: MFS transporter [Candidatus Sungiibacteriota bacterium]|uniref:MFS transporter n=1 Tax=Candidatus Sungiibacteriota bacterium TaxID=2750080 RepID=A0A7T5RKR0_9BACT|nr:MAG: MFS transporter [Candidatus Sungbacteria bacterium]
MEQNVQKPTKIFGLSRNVVSMGVVSFLNDLSSDMVFPFIPIFLTSVLGATATFVGLVEGVADATASILKIISGRLSDKVRRRKPFVVFGYSLSALAKPILAVAVAPWHVLAVRFLDRVGKGTRDAPRDALLSFSTDKKDVGRAFGFHRTADTLGAAAGPLLAFLLLPLIGNNLRTLFLLSFVASFFAVLILKLTVREVGNHVEQTERPKFEFKYLGLPFVVFLIAATIFSLGRASEAFLLLRAQNVGVALALLPIIYFVYNITLAIFSTPAGMLSDKIGHRNTFMIGMLIFAATYFLFAGVSSVSTVWLLFAMYGLAAAFIEGVGRAIVADLVEEKWRATAYGMYNAFTGFALLPASLVFGFLWDKFGPAVSFQYGAILGVVAFIIFLFLRMKNSHHEGVDTRQESV